MPYKGSKGSLFRHRPCRYKLISVGSLIAILLLSSIPLSSSDVAEAKDGYFASGSGVRLDPYIIEDVLDLQAMGRFPDLHYALLNDIDANITREWNSGAGFDPVGTREKPFTGSLDGRNMEITGLYIDRPDRGDVGLFGSLGSESFVKGVRLENVEVKGYSSVGALAGRSDRGMVSKVSARGSVEGGGERIGGIVGLNLGTVANCITHITILSSESDSGGIVGKNDGGSVLYSISNGDVEGGTATGGIVGLNVKGEIYECGSSSQVYGTIGVGGVVGWNEEGSIDLCFFQDRVEGLQYVGGITGSNYRGVVSNSHSDGNVFGTNRYCGGISGRNQEGSVVNSHYNIDGVLINGGDHVTIGGLFQGQYNDWIENGFALNIIDYSETLIPCGGHFEIYSVQGLKDLLGFSDRKGARFLLRSDLDLHDHPGFHIPYLGGCEFDGGGNVISNLRIDLPFSENVGLFGHNDGGTIMNLGLYGSRVNGTFRVGGLVGNNNGTVMNCHIEGELTGMNYVGGLIGVNHAQVRSSCSSGQVRGEESVGGLLGQNVAGSVLDCYSIADVRGFGANVGGLIGANWAPVERVYSTGSVEGSGVMTGGLIGLNVNDQNLNSCFWDILTSSTDIGIGGGSTRGALGSSTPVMKMKGTYSDWDLTTTWCMLDQITYPYFKFQDRTPPRAVAGSDQFVDEGVYVVFDGSASDDNIGIDNYTWTIDNEDAVLYGKHPAHRFPIGGVYTVMLNVSDPSGNRDTDIMIVSVRDITPPVAEAGEDLLVDKGAHVVFNGSSSRDAQKIVNYTWTFEYGKAIVVLFGVINGFTFNVVGIYPVRLRVSYPSGSFSEDVMNLTVRDASIRLANAGEDLIVPIGTEVILNGAFSLDDAQVKMFSWRFEYNESVRTIYGRSLAFTFDISGRYDAKLRVQDVYGNIFDDTVSITVIDTGIVKGIVLDENGDPVKGAQVKITASNDEEYSIETGTNGSFSLEIFHGPFSWIVAKDGYEHIYGDGEIAPMEEMFLDLSGDPMVRERGSGSLILILLLISIMALAAAGIAMFLLRRKKGDTLENVSR
ncbi:MAG: PKD domain-containing protein [Candidatus Thermoplasmatota archaeon]|nr:PKD domain-containing protein [Candidatus Thermoplasmatota archaeon]